MLKPKQYARVSNEVKLLRNLSQNITVLDESWFSIPQYNLSLLFCIPNMNFLSYIVVEISLTKMWRERKKDVYKEE